MNLRKTIIFVAMIIIPISTIALNNAAGTYQTDNWEPVGTGIEFQQFRLTDPVPVNVFVARMDRENSDVIIESSIAQGRLSGGLQTVSGMAERYNQAINNWSVESTTLITQTWGNRNDVVVAINGFYYGGDVEPPGVPWSGQVQSGWYSKRYTDKESISGFVWKMDRNTFIGECITHESTKQVVYIANGEDQFEFFIDGLNLPRNEDELILYTSHFDSDTNTKNSSDSIEILVEMKGPTYISIAGDMPEGKIRQIRDGKGSTPIPFDHIVISAQGIAAAELKMQFALNKISIGNDVAIAQRVKDCVNPSINRWIYSYAGVGGQFYFLRDGIIYDYADNGQANVRDPRTAIAYNDKYIYFIVADGRDPGVSEGMKVIEIAEFAKNALGATHGIMQDGGGSSTMVINGEVVNNTLCNNIFCANKIFIPLIINSSDTTSDSNNLSPQSEQDAQWATEAQALQRLVANGMMMVVVEPMARSTQPYDPGDPISSDGSINIFLGPGNNYAVLDTSSGEGTISDSLNQLGGVFAKGSYWWKVQFGSIEGWVNETDIFPVPKSQSSTEFKPR
jgi:hypothetical protein